jgi:hypothetical protein
MNMIATVILEARWPRTAAVLCGVCGAGESDLEQEGHIRNVYEVMLEPWIRGVDVVAGCSVLERPAVKRPTPGMASWPVVVVVRSNGGRFDVPAANAREEDERRDQFRGGEVRVKEIGTVRVFLKNQFA